MPTILVRDRSGRLIPAKGRPSRILAKNLIPGDKFCLTGNKVGKVLGVWVFVDGQEVLETEAVVRTPKGKKFEKFFERDDRVWVVETPKSRLIRRKYARMGMARPTVSSIQT